MKVTAVFDIGRTNKKFFLFDGNFKEVYREYTRFEEITDEDGYPTEDLTALEHWAKSVFDRMIASPDFDIVALNFSCYGASLVHIDANGKVLAPLYNYMKPLKSEVVDSFYEAYGPVDEFSRVTGSLNMGMLNTGMHLFWLKRERPEVFKKIKYSLHLPQYLSYLFTGIPVSEYTSIGCHTILWDYEKNKYHDWVFREGVDKKLPPIVDSNRTVSVAFGDRNIEVGPGIHDSSSALLPYVRSISDPFLLVSTGTWSISINPFAKGMLTLDDIKRESMFNMRIDGSPVKVARLFLGNEYKLQVKELTARFGVPADYHRTVRFDGETFFEINKDFEPMFKWKSIEGRNEPRATTIPYDKFEHAYHQLMLELVMLQVESIKSAIGDQPITDLYIDGGFSDNDVYINLLSYYLRDMKLRTTDASLGSALGAAIVISGTALDTGFLARNYGLKDYSSLKSINNEE
ncbi:FGGY-family carbohydrate kinase [Pseudozobellia thermophila]|uniref:Sugar (Pentulose or hexulose) kinase n=1 Tax=Pseudozobellia thermophila TaxID=192903 RepID=A0A1M6CAU6_9FLAO|nr:FGGY family carbohydrate kinase [Pseudozobellia thermophila]SHI58116.1 Sugar (pentulose or hexulose) kinase [Pseudozobellia thermophila]